MDPLASGKDEVLLLPSSLIFLAWNLGQLLVEHLVRRWNPRLDRYLTSGCLSRRRTYAFYGYLVLSAILKSISLPYCALATVTTPGRTDLPGLPRPLSHMEQMCATTRTVLVMAELPAVLHHPEILVHHALQLAVGFTVFWHRMPRRQLYLTWAVLLSEVFNNLRQIVRLHSDAAAEMTVVHRGSTSEPAPSNNADENKDEKSRNNKKSAKPSTAAEWWLLLATAVALTVLRIPAIFVSVLWLLEAPAHAMFNAVAIGCYALYLCYVSVLSYRLFRSVGAVAVEPDPAGRSYMIVLLGGLVSIRCYDLFVSLAACATFMSSLVVFMACAGDQLRGVAIGSITQVGLGAAVIGMAGAWLAAQPIKLARAKSFVLRELRNGESQGENFFALGGMFTAAAFVLWFPGVDNRATKPALVACSALSLPLGSAVAALGASLSSCSAGSSKRTRRREGSHHAQDPEKGREFSSHIYSTPVIPISLTACLFHAELYVGFLTLLVFGAVDLCEAGWLVLGMHGVVRLAVEPLRRDLRNRVYLGMGFISLTWVLTVVQIVFAVWNLGSLAPRGGDAVDDAYAGYSLPGAVDPLGKGVVSLAAWYVVLRMKVRLCCRRRVQLEENTLPDPDDDEPGGRKKARRHILGKRTMAIAVGLLLIAATIIGTVMDLSPNKQWEGPRSLVDVAPPEPGLAARILRRLLVSPELMWSLLGILVLPVTVLTLVGVD